MFNFLEIVIYQDENGMTEHEQKKWERMVVTSTFSNWPFLFQQVHIVLFQQQVHISFWQNSQNFQDFRATVNEKPSLGIRYILSIRPKCTKRRESGFHFRISINLLHPLLQPSTINTFYQICAKFLLFEKGSSSTSSGEDYYFSPKLVYLGF